MMDKVLCAVCMKDLEPNGRMKSVEALKRQHEKQTGHDLFQEYYVLLYVLFFHDVCAQGPLPYFYFHFSSRSYST